MSQMLALLIIVLILYIGDAVSVRTSMDPLCFCLRRAVSCRLLDFLPQ